MEISSVAYESMEKTKQKLNDKLDPRTKLAWYGLMILFALICETPFQLIVVLCVGMTVSLILKGSLKQYRVMIAIMLLLGLQMLILQLLFCREGMLLYQWGMIKIYSEAIPLTVLGMLRTTVIVFASMQFLTSASPTEFTLMLMKFKVPYRFAMLVGLGVRFLPLMKAEYLSIIESQSIRGLKMEKVWDKIKAIIPTFLPFLYRAVRRSTEIALAMDLRGYGQSKTRTFASNIEIKTYDRVLISGIFLIMILSSLYKMAPFAS
ncbi:energy-coupling factor transporter transmembrane protein EcfT [Dehalobacterium formicoaceticum]|uniref:Energy-coupling factor transporter transmembrane protein EcfT n=1 Tax=Dehalobacterium formicoaceticum TaxID=51515 RepID=A0ABT1Y6N8_9FIRM|nr:energy-coupling factor transporter transmembrane component T [Dehalobacterium formicoaceticum]MCR6545574.1 energy-coupling factor transporter transmembrane protein EcfT [Dehalobacterium formicoaceticum]